MPTLIEKRLARLEEQARQRPESLEVVISVFGGGPLRAMHTHNGVKVRYERRFVSNGNKIIDGIPLTINDGKNMRNAHSETDIELT